MQYTFTKMMEIYDHLQDEESRSLFNARVAYLLNTLQGQDIDAATDEFLKIIEELYDNKDWHSSELEEKITSINPKGIIIFGCGHDGRMTYRLLTSWGYQVSYFCDNFRCGEVVEGKKVLSLGDVLKYYREYLIVISSSKFGKEMYIDLIQKSFPPEYILLPEYQIVWASRGKQYFDLFEPRENEIFIDAGAFDGQTILDFVKWSKGKYEKIYAFEAVDQFFQIANKNIEGLDRVKIFNYAVWDKQEQISFHEKGSASSYSDMGKIRANGMDLDSVIGSVEEVTFIKMDIEGSERRALEGAKKIIIKNHPRLAICIYHKPIDIIELPEYLLRLVPEYKFYIRHYGSHMGEEILYAVI